MCGWFLFAPGSSLAAFLSLRLDLGCWAERKSRLKRRLHSTAAAVAGGGCMLGAGTLQRSTTTGNNAEKLGTSRERRMSRVSSNSGKEQLRIKKPQWRWTCQLGSNCVLKHVHLEERRSERFCFLPFHSLCSSDDQQPEVLSSRLSVDTHSQNISKHDFITPQLSFPDPSLLRRKLEFDYATAVFSD